MNKKIIVISGYLASGKSTFALQLSEALKVPYLIKDTFKTAICEDIAIADRNESKRFSAATFSAMMYVTERMFETGYPVIIEGNFVPAGVKKADEARTIRNLIARYGYSSMTFKFSGDTRVLHKRFVEREKTPERGQANKMGLDVVYEDFDRWCHELDSFDVGGEIIEVDTTDFGAVDYEQYYKIAKQFIRN